MWISEPWEICRNPIFAMDSSSTGNIRAIVSVIMAALRKTGRENSSSGSFRTTIRSPIPAAANGWPAWFRRRAETGGGADALLALLAAACSWERNMGRPRLFSTSPVLKICGLAMRSATDAKGNWGRITLGERFRRSAGADHVRAVPSWIGRRLRLHLMPRC